MQFSFSNLFSTIWFVICALQNLLCVIFFEEHCIAHIAFAMTILNSYINSLNVAVSDVCLNFPIES